MKEKLKMIQLNETTHKKIKLNAVKKDMSIKEYVEYLLSLDGENKC